MKIELEQECEACGGTGLYRGGYEKNGAAVVCNNCDGTGCFKFVHTYEPFRKRKPVPGAKRVYARNPGIGIGEEKKEFGLELEDFGGMPYADWAKGKKFPAGSEMRKFTCPFWWYGQRVKVVGCDDQMMGCRYSDCKHFANKAECWRKFDKGEAEDKRKEK